MGHVDKPPDLRFGRAPVKSRRTAAGSASIRRARSALVMLNIVVAVTSFGLNAYCRGTDFAYRTDTQAVHDWLQSVLTDAEWDAVVIS